MRVTPLETLAPIPRDGLLPALRHSGTRFVEGDPVAHLERDEMAEIERAITRYLGLAV